MNKPVAYGMLTFCKNCGEQNPYQYRELTDEEIEECWFAKGWQKSVYTKDLITLAREILRKAQEK